MKNYIDFFTSKKITVMGLGLLGGALNDIKFLLECGVDLTITDMKTEAELLPSVKKLQGFAKSHKLKANSYQLHLGGHRLEDFRDKDFILQPGNVPPDSPYLLEAQKNNIPIHESESLFMETLRSLEEGKMVKVIGVTGTRGKTTTTVLIYEILKAAFGRRVHLAGNVKGASTLALLKKIKSGDIVVLELDSWCLHGMGEVKKSPNVAVFTTFMPDHLNFYLKGSATESEALQKYFMDKVQVFAHQTADDFLILDKEMEKTIGERYMGKILSQIKMIKAKFPTGWKTALKGEHNLKHILRAAEVGKIFGVSEKVMKKAVADFKGVEGRQEFVREYKGIKIYNDTTATTPEATIAALRALGNRQSKNIVLIMGGADKNLNTADLLKEIPKFCHDAILLPGTGSAKLAAGYFTKAADLKDAIKQGMGRCRHGDILLFSPAFASFGMFKNEYHRGETFLKLIK